MKKAQGTLEYLVIIAVVLLVAGVVVYLITGSASVSKKNVLINNCQAAAEKCNLHKAANPSDSCSFCDTQCVDSSSGKEVFNGAIDCCKQGNSSGIYEGSVGCNAGASVQKCSSPSECNDADFCTFDSCVSGTCQHQQITACKNDDGCCPSSCDYTTDNDCPEICIDNDNDGYGNPAAGKCAHPSLDCNDSNPQINPGIVEDCYNGIDDNCNGDVDRNDDYCNVDSISTVGSCATSGNDFDVFVQGDYAYVADTSKGLHIIDVSDKTKPVEVGNASGKDWDVFVQGDYAYVVDSDNGLVIFDVSDKTNPVEVASYNSVDSIEDVSVYQGSSYRYAYLAAGMNGLIILNVTDMSNIQEVGSYDGITALRLFSIDPFIYVTSDDGNLTTIRVINKKSPTRLDSIKATTSSIRGIFVDKRTSNAFVSSDGGLDIINASIIFSLSKLGSYDDGSSYAYNSFVSNNYAFVADGSGGLKVIDVIDPTSPSYVTKWLGYSLGVFVDYPYVYSASGSSGLYIGRVA